MYLKTKQGIFYLKSIVCPWSELHKARLLVKREVPDVYLAGWLEDRWRSPDNLAAAVKHSLCHRGDHVLPVRAATLEQTSALLHRLLTWRALRTRRLRLLILIDNFLLNRDFPGRRFELSPVTKLCAVFFFNLDIWFCMFPRYAPLNPITWRHISKGTNLLCYRRKKPRFCNAWVAVPP